MLDYSPVWMFVAAAVGFITYELIRLYAYIDEIREGTVSFSHSYFIYMALLTCFVGVAVITYMKELGIESLISAYVSGVSFPSTITFLLSTKLRSREINVEDTPVGDQETGRLSQGNLSRKKRTFNFGELGQFFRLP